MEKKSGEKKTVGEHIISCTVENVSKLDATANCCCYEWTFSFSWKIYVQMVLKEDTKYLRFYLRHVSTDHPSLWSFQVSADFRFLSYKEGQKPLTKKCEQFFECGQNNDHCESPCMIPMQQVLDPEHGYIQNDAIKLEVHINMESTFPLTEDKKTDTINDSNTCNHPDLMQNYKKMYEEKLFTDFVVRTGDREFEVHKAVLAACSPVFKAMISSEMIEKTEGYVTIDDFSVDVVEQLLQFFYTSTIDNKFKNFFDLYLAADKYDLPELQKICDEKMMLRVSCADAIDILLHSKKYNRLKLKRHAMAFILRHVNEIVRLPAFKLMCENHIDLAMIIMRHMSVFKRKLARHEGNVFY